MDVQTSDEVVNPGSVDQDHIRAAKEHMLAHARGEAAGEAYALKLISNLSYLIGLAESSLSASDLDHLDEVFFGADGPLKVIRRHVVENDPARNGAFVTSFIEGMLGELGRWDCTVTNIGA